MSLTKYDIRYTTYRIGKRVIGMIMLCLCAFSCAQKGEDCTLKISVVEQASGKPLPGVEIKLAGKILGQSDAAGLCSVQCKLAHGRYKLSCEQDGYIKVEWGMELAAQEAAVDEDFMGEPSLLDEIGELAAEFDYRIELVKEEE